MIPQFYINSTPATAFGAMMGEGFLDELLTPAPKKAAIENSSRLEHGKRVILNNKLNSRDITLEFQLWGSTPEELRQRLSAFENAISGGVFTLRINTTELYSIAFRLYYVSSSKYAFGTGRCNCTVAAKFVEPNPANRS